jgi:hypothetical protein
MLFLPDEELWQFHPKTLENQFSRLNGAHWKTLTSTSTTNKKLYLRHELGYTYNKHHMNISWMCACRYLKHTLQVKYGNSAELTCVSANTQNCRRIGKRIPYPQARWHIRNN